MTLKPFFESYYRLRPVNATFTGVHDYDDRLPDWSPEGLAAAADEMRILRADLGSVPPASLPRPSSVPPASLLRPSPVPPASLLRPSSVPPPSLLRPSPVPLASLDRELAMSFLDVQIAELESDHFQRRNPSLAIGEAVFGVISLMTRPFAAVGDRVEAAIARLNAIPDFLAGARRTHVANVPDEWRLKCLKECDGAEQLLRDGIGRWIALEHIDDSRAERLRRAAERAGAAFESFRRWLAHDVADAAADRYACGPELFDLLLARGHWCDRTRATLSAAAQRALDDALEQLDARARAIAPGGWANIQQHLTNDHPTVDDYLSTYQRVWDACRERAEEHDLVTWPASPIRYVPIPTHTRDAAPFLYYLFYRSPAPFDRLPIHDYVVTPIDADMPADEQLRRLRATNTSVIKLNHVVHHGAIGHHVQNYYAYAGASEIGRVAAVDCASRIGMFLGGTMAEGWACYATDLMDEVGFLTPEESIAQQHTRARALARAVVDIGLHERSLTFDDAVAIYRDRIGMSPEAARAETCKNSMFPGTAIMYWLGTETLRELRRERQRIEGASFSPGRFHDGVLAFGSIPVTLIAKLMSCVVLALALILSAACARRSAATPPSNDLLIVGYDREPDTLNRFSTHILEDIQSCVVEGLTTTDERMNVVPLLATEVPTTANGGVRLRPDGGMDVTWKLRPGVTWHDGNPFTSADVKFTVDAINGPNYNPESTDGFDRISSVDTPDPLTAIVHYREIYAPYDIQFNRGTLPRHVLDGRDIDRAQDYNRGPLGTGPYRVAEWRAGEYILLERVPHYWRGDAYPHIRRLMFKFIANTNTRINQLKSGEVHVVALVPWDKYREIAGMSSIVIHKTPGNAYEHVTLNERQFPPFADVRVRRALMLALDRELFTRTILDGLAPVAHGPIQPVSWAYTDQIAHYPFDPSRARALLDEAGWKAGSSGIRQREGRPLAFTLITQAGYAIRENVAQAIERQLRDVGVDVKVELHDGTAISQIWFEGRFDAMLHWWQMPSDPELTTFFAADRTPPAGRNINYFKDEELTALLYASDRTVNREERKKLLHRAQAIVADAAPEIPLYSVTRLDAVPAALQHFKGNPTNTGIFWNVHEWSIK